MKKKAKKLTLSKMTILNLSSQGMEIARGGVVGGSDGTCKSYCAATCPGNTCGGTTFTGTCTEWRCY